MTLDAGTLVLDRYVADSLLGRGGMGAVYRGRHATLGFAVALKVLDEMESAELTRRFAREAAAMARVRHHHVVSILDYGLAPDGRPCIAMELIEGEPLDVRLRRVGPLPWLTAAALARELLEGLGAIHGAGLLHRDLKPSNILLARGRPEHLKIVDFGIAKSLAPSATRLTQTGMMLGTPAYMSPQQALGDAVDERTDLYAVGAVLYELLTGRPPFAESGARAMFRRAVEEVPPPRAPAPLPAVPQELVAFVLTLLAIEPARRPHSTEAAAEALKAAVLAARERPSPAPDATAPLPVPAAPLPVAAPVSAHAQTVATGSSQAQLLFVAQLPSSRLALPEERKYLASLLPGGKSFTLGAALWIALWPELAATDAERAARALGEQLQARYGDLIRVAWQVLDAPLGLTAAMLAGATPLPPALRQLLERVTGTPPGA